MRGGQTLGLHFSASSVSPSNSSLQTSSQVCVGPVLVTHDQRAQCRLVHRRVETDIELAIGDDDIRRGHGQRGLDLAIPKQHDIKIIDDPFPFGERIEDAIATRIVLGLSEVERDVVSAVCEFVSDPDIALAIALVKKGVLRAFDRLHRTDLAAGYRFLGRVRRTIDAHVFRAADIDCPDEIGDDVGLLGRFRCRGIGLAAGSDKGGRREE